MISNKMQLMAQSSSVIRAMFEEGKRMAAEVGAENVFDFSLGNPSVPAPASIKEAAIDILQSEDPMLIHGYMSNAGYEDVRQTVAESLNRRFGTNYDLSHIMMTVGAAGGLNIALKVLLNPGDEVLVLAPFFGEYRSYIANYDGEIVIVPAKDETFLPDPALVAKAITPRTKAAIINTPNNPSGVVYPAETIAALAKVLNERSAELGTTIYLLADEPYRELVYDPDTIVPWIPDFYDNTIVCYSWSKSLSLPGERIGYMVMPSTLTDCETIQSAASIAGRILGFVNAPSLMQRVAARCVDEQTDLAAYAHNRDLLYNGLTRLGYQCVYPAGAFYLFIKTPEPEADFVARAKAHHILLVPGNGFGGPGYVRAAYCVSADTIERSLPVFAEMAKELGL